MENKTNQALIVLLQSKRNLFLSLALKKCRNPDLAEDLVQSVLCKLLRLEITVEVCHPKQFLIQMIKKMNLNHRTVNKKYVMVDIHAEPDDDDDDNDHNTYMDELIQNTTGCSFEDDLMDSFQLKEVREAANALPNLQRESILASLAGRDIADGIGGVQAYNTLSATRRHAILKLRKKFKEEK